MLKYKIAKAIRWICLVYNICFLLFLFLVEVEVLAHNERVIRTVFYSTLLSWAIGIMTKFIAPKKQEKGYLNEK